MPSLLTRFNSTAVTFIGFFFLFSLLIVSNISQALAQVNEPRGGPGVYKYETPEVWRESFIDFPPLSPKSSFSQYQTRSQTGFNFYLDVSSIKLTADGVVRISLLAISPKGSENITYEGFRCETREYKLYASSWGFDEKWILAKRTKWKTPSYSTANTYRSDLLEFYICNGVLNVNEKAMKALLKKGKMNKHDGRRGREF